MLEPVLNVIGIRACLGSKLYHFIEGESRLKENT